MLVTLKDVLKIAEAQKNAVGAFNGPDMTCARAVIAAAEEMNRPIVLMHAQIHENTGICKMEEVAPMLLHLADKAKVPVCVHLDHGEDLEYVKRGLELGFTSVMYDGSHLGEEMNVANTCIAVEMAARTGASVEAEIGSMGARETGAGETLAEDKEEAIYTDPKAAVKFVETTGIDALACSFGAVHGVYLKEPKLDFNRLAEIKKHVDVPLVMHGGSGVSDDDFRKIISLGVRKINYYTYMAKVGAEAINNLNGEMFYHNMLIAAMGAMKEDVKAAIKVFSNL